MSWPRRQSGSRRNRRLPFVKELIVTSPALPLSGTDNGDDEIQFFFDKPIQFTPTNPPSLAAGAIQVRIAGSGGAWIPCIGMVQNDEIGAVWTCDFVSTVTSGNYEIRPTSVLQATDGSQFTGGPVTIA